MKRRGFFKLIAGVLLAPFVPAGSANPFDGVQITGSRGVINTNLNSLTIEITIQPPPVYYITVTCEFETPED